MIISALAGGGEKWPSGLGELNDEPLLLVIMIVCEERGRIRRLIERARQNDRQIFHQIDLIESIAGDPFERAFFGGDQIAPTRYSGKDEEQDAGWLIAVDVDQADDAQLPGNLVRVLRDCL